jgi:hypothetical protein
MTLSFISNICILLYFILIILLSIIFPNEIYQRNFCQNQIIEFYKKELLFYEHIELLRIELELIKKNYRTELESN